MGSILKRKKWFWSDKKIFTTKALCAHRNTKEVITQKYINDIAYKVVGCAIEVHKNRGPGLLESVYETCLIEEISDSGLIVQSQLYIQQMVPMVTEEFSKLPKS